MNYFLIALAALFLFGAKKKNSLMPVQIDFSVLQNGGRYQLAFTDSLSNVTTFDSNNGLLQSGNLVAGTYTITLTKIQSGGCPAFVEVDTNSFVSDLGSNTQIAPLQSNYVLILQCR